MTAVDAGSVFFGARAVPWMVLATAVAIGSLAPAATAAAAPWPFLLALVAFGMPHGAADWSVAARLADRRRFSARLGGFSSYLLMMAASLGLIAWQPGFAGLLFLLLTTIHFGMADATALDADGDGPTARWGLALGRGLLLLATAFAMNPEAAWAPFARIGESLSPMLGSVWQPEIPLLRRQALFGMAFGAVLALSSAFARIRRGRGRIAALDLAEHALVVAMALLADPLFAVGCYFLGVHAFRHSRRLACTSILMKPSAGPIAHSLHEPSPSSRLLRVHRMSLPLMWPTALCLAALCWFLGGLDVRTITVASIAFYMITTLPHHLLGLRLPTPDMPPVVATRTSRQ